MTIHKAFVCSDNEHATRLTVTIESEPPFAGNDAEPQLPLSNQQS